VVISYRDRRTTENSSVAAYPGPMELLTAAQQGDENAFGSLIDPFHGELHAHCYRMLGSVHDAEDALQEASLRAWRGLARFEGRSSLRSWLYTIATNTCLNQIARRPKRVLPLDYGPSTDPQDGVGEPLIESVWVEPYPDEHLGVEDGFAAPEARYERRESVELAFIAAVQHLPATQRAVLILRDVLGFSAREVAESLDTTVASANSALQRARKTVDERFPEQSQQATLRALGDQKLRGVVEGYMDAMQRGDVDAVVSMLAEDAAWSMPPLAAWFTGLEGIRGFLTIGPLSGEFRWRHLPAHVNGQVASAAYSWIEAEQAYLPFALDVLTLEDDRIKEITSFISRSTLGRDPEYYARFPDQAGDPGSAAAFERFGLPGRLG
jgi:RNA polymerase sigma-70 factor (ECF subfamily)